jgi:hypothetical protein
MQQDNPNEGHQILPVDNNIHSNTAPTLTLIQAPMEPQNSTWSLEALSEYLFPYNLQSSFIQVDIYCR